MAAARRVSEPTGRTFGANLGAAAAQHLAPAIRRSFPRGNGGLLRRRATQRLAPLGSSATSTWGRDSVLVTHLAQASARCLLRT